MYSYVYIMTNAHNTVLYIGVTNNLEKSVWEHINSIDKGSFTYKYNCHKLVCYEVFEDIRLKRLSEMGDPLEKVSGAVDWEIFHPILNAVFHKEA